MEIPVSNLNACVVGAVSAGKSTFTNSLFLRQFSPTSIKRTTMVPVLYVENDLEYETDSKTIYETLDAKNKELIEKSEKGAVSATDCNELVFHVGPLNFDIADCHFNIYDIPGLNDARTKAVYYQYLKTKFPTFNIILLLVDLQSGMNTSDEMDIVKFIVAETVANRTRDIRTLVIANKADDMQLVGDTLTFEGEMQLMFDQVVQTVTDSFATAGISDKLIGVAPLCAIDAYLYRMIAKYGDAFTLSTEQMLKIGINDSGKKFSKFPRSKQEKMVSEIVKNETFLTDMIQLSGFSGVEKMLSNYLCGTYKTAQVANVMASLQPYDVDAELASWIPSYSSPLLFFRLDQVNVTTIGTHLTKYRQEILPLDKQLYKEKMDTLFGKVYSTFMSFPLGQLLCETEQYYCFIGSFDDFRKYIVQDWPLDFDFNGEDVYSDAEVRTLYPDYIKRCIRENLFTRYYNFELQLHAVQIMDRVGILTQQNAMEYFDAKLGFGAHHVWKRKDFGDPHWNPKDLNNPLPKLMEIVALMKNVLDKPAMIQTTLILWTQYVAGVKEDAFTEDENYIRKVLHLKAGFAETVAVLDALQQYWTLTLCKSVLYNKAAVKDDPRFALDYFLFSLL